MKCSWERILATVVALYAVVLTQRHYATPPVNALCTRDFITPSASGSCLCGEGQYCLCTPSLAADVIIELEDAGGNVESIVFIERRDGRGLAMVGGFVRVGEAAEDAAAREALEETGLTTRELRQWCMFSKPDRDPRRHTAALVHVARARGVPKAGDDAKGIRTVPLLELQRRPPRFAFDHGLIVAAFVARFHPLKDSSRSQRAEGMASNGRHRRLGGSLFGRRIAASSSYGIAVTSSYGAHCSWK